MLSVTITEKDGPSTTSTFDKTEVLIGRVKGNDVVLPKTNVSKRHSRIVVKDGKIILIDLKSTNGTFINGRKITGPHVMQEGDKVFIGDFTIEVHEVGGGAAPVQAPIGMPNAAPIGMPNAAPMGVPASAPMGVPASAPMGAPAPAAPAYGGVPNVAPMPAAPNASPLPPSVQPIQNMPSHGPELSPNPNFARPSMSNMSPIGGGAPLGVNSGINLGDSSIPQLNAPSIGPANISAPSMGGDLSSPMGAGPALSAPSLSAPQSPSLAGPSAQPLGASRPVGGGSLNKLSPSNEGVIDKSLRLSGSAQAERSIASSKSLSGGSRQNLNKKDFGAAALPEDIVVDDARTIETENWIKAARIVMDKYLTDNDFQMVASQPYPPESDVQDTCYSKLSKCVNSMRSSLSGVNIESLLDFLLKEACGLGAIDSLIDDAEVSAFTVYNFETIVVERKGRREISHLQFTSADTLYLAAQRLLTFQGLNPQTPPAISEIRFGDGTQVEVLMPPVSVASTTIVVRKTNHEFNALSALVQHGYLSSEMDKFLKLCVKARRNILIVGAQGSGRTSLLNALGSEIPNGERIVTAEDTAMLVLPQPYVISLEAQNSNISGGELSTLVRQTSRLRAERVLVDSIKTPAEAGAFVGAICAGAQGSIATLCALNANEGFNLLKNMLQSDAASKGLLGNIDIVITVRAFTSAQRRIVEISEVSCEDDGTYKLIPLFGWLHGGMGNMATGDGQFKALGNIPKFYRELERGGMALDPSIFNA